MNSQNDQVLHALKSGPITALDAFKSLNVLRLASRIFELKDSGHIIHTEMISNNGKRYAKYHLLKIHGGGTG
jgi:hypothetical protein